MSTIDMKFKKIDGTDVGDVSEYIKNYIETRDGEIDVMIGCDSLPKRYRQATYTTVIAIYTVGKGAHIIYCRENKVKFKVMFDRLWGEVERCVQVAQFLRDSSILEISKVRNLDVHLHLDLNPDAGGGANKSNAIIDAAVGYVHSLGFKCSTKPNAPAASYAADTIARGKEQNGYIV
jgi:predicted RNase H-related nuclease YkuK (DUF458 family)